MPAVVVAGTDSSGGAGLCADVLSLACFGVPCRLAVTGTSAQDRSGLRALAPVTAEHLLAQLASASGFPDAPVKVGMLPSAGLVAAAAGWLARRRSLRIADPVTGPSAGGCWAGPGWRAEYLRRMPAACDIVTPNLAEARMLAGLAHGTAEQCARALLRVGFVRVLVTSAEVVPGAHCDDLYASARRSYVLRGAHVRDSGRTRGTGCSFSSALAALAALGYGLDDALVVAKMHVAERIAGCAAGFPDARRMPEVLPSGGEPPLFRPLSAAFGVCPITASAGALDGYADAGLRSVQLRVKRGARAHVARIVAAAAATARRRGLRLFVNDHWELAVQYAGAGVHGAHLGQEDVRGADLGMMRRAGLRLGLSAHGWHELACARGLRPSYVALGPVYATARKRALAPLGVGELRRMTCPPDAGRTVAIGGLSAANVGELAAAGLCGVASIAGARTPAAAAAMAREWRRGLARRRRWLRGNPGGLC